VSSNKQSRSTITQEEKDFNFVKNKCGMRSNIFGNATENKSTRKHLVTNFLKPKAPKGQGTEGLFGKEKTTYTKKTQSALPISSKPIEHKEPDSPVKQYNKEFHGSNKEVKRKDKELVSKNQDWKTHQSKTTGVEGMDNKERKGIILNSNLCLVNELSSKVFPHQERMLTVQKCESDVKTVGNDWKNSANCGKTNNEHKEVNTFESRKT
jgi:hypothetical protein